MRSPSSLHAYQAEAVEFLYERTGAALFAAMGLGKTGIVLTLLARLKREGLLGRALVIGPLRVVNETWPDEIGAWAHTKGLTFSVVTGAAKDRLRALETPADLHLTNRENVEWLVSQFVRPKGKKWEMYRRWPYDVVVIDELTGFGDSGSKRFRALKLVRKHVKRLYGLTASPAAEGYMKMFAMCYLLDGGERLGTHITHYREAYFSQNPYTHQWTIQAGAEDRITEKIADVVLTLRRERKPDDKPTFIDRAVRLTDAQLEQYHGFERDFYLEAADGTEITAVHAAALATKLLQLSSGFIYDADRKPHFIHKAKIDALAELIEEAQGEPLICAYWFKPSLAMLKEAFPQGRVLDEKGETQRAWNAGKVPLLFLHPMSGGFGINLQAGGSVLAFYDMPAPYEKYEQTVGRIDRQGQTRSVRVYHLIAAGTADEDAVERLSRKEDVQNAFFERIRKFKEANR
jgi:SNF2 family DNA or RNA helicase